MKLRCSLDWYSGGFGIADRRHIGTSSNIRSIIESQILFFLFYSKELSQLWFLQKGLKSCQNCNKKSLKNPLESQIGTRNQVQKDGPGI